MQKKTVYEKPSFCDLSGYTAQGQDKPMGECKSGLYPYYNCVTGPDYLAACTPGLTADTSKCTSGGVHTDFACNFGNDATTKCSSGGHQQA